LGQHALDIVHWFLGATAPVAVTSTGGRIALRDNGETPDTQDALFEYPGWSATWSHRECSRGAAPASGLEFCGTRGSLMDSRRGSFAVAHRPRAPPRARTRPDAPPRPGAGGGTGHAAPGRVAARDRGVRGAPGGRFRPSPPPRPPPPGRRGGAPRAGLEPG